MAASSGAPEPIIRLVEAFNRLPGIGPKSAQRLAYHILRAPESEAQGLAHALTDVKARIRLCRVCQNITEQTTCALCTDDERDPTVICVVEQPFDVVAIERVARYRGRYHVLHGVLSPMEGIGPEHLRVRELIERLKDGQVRELIMATNPSLEGEATAMYVQRFAGPLEVRVTHLARGLPSGADLEYTDDVTLARAFEGRQDL